MKKQLQKAIMFIAALAFLFSFKISADAATQKAPAPEKVTGVKQTNATSSSITLSWNIAAGNQEGYYGIQISQDGTNNWTLIEKANKCESTLSNLNAGTTYYVRIFAYSGYYWSSNTVMGAPSDPIEVKTTPGKVNNVIQTDATMNSISLSWDAAPNASGYDIFYKDTFLTSTDTNQVTIGQLQPNTSYTNSDWKVFSYVVNNAGVKLTDSNSASPSKNVLTVPNKYSTSQFKVDTYSSNQVSFIAQRNENTSVSGYEIKGKAVRGKKSFDVDTTNTYGTSKILVAKNTMYKYRARPYIIVNGRKIYAGWSKYRYFALQTMNCRTYSQHKKIKIAWKRVKGASKYDIYISNVAKDAGYKKVTSISGKSKANTYTITKCGKRKLKSSTYYVKVLAKTKVGKKMKKSDIYVYSSSYVY